MENEKNLKETKTMTDEPKRQELDESLLKDVTGGASDEDWDIKLPYKYEIGQLVLVPVLGEGVWKINHRFHMINAEIPTNMYAVTQKNNGDIVGEMLIFPIA